MNQEFVKKAIASELNRDSIDGISILNLNSKTFTNKGDNFVCEIEAVEVEATVDGEKRAFKYVCKIAPENRKELIKKMNLFIIEANTYNYFFPWFSEINGKRRLLKAPKSYYASHENGILFMENLNEEGYRLADKKAGLDMEHLKIVLDELAYLHSYSTELMKSDKAKDIADLLKFNEPPDINTLYGLAKSIFISIVTALVTSGHEDLANKVEKKIINNMTDILITAFDWSKSGFKVISHGDCWVNNFLFKYGDDGKLLDLKILDWQGVRLSSNAMDVGHVLSSCTRVKNRKENTDELLRFYYDRFTFYEKELGEKTSDIYPYDCFIDDYKNSGLYRYVISAFMIPVIFMDYSERDGFELIDENVFGVDGASKFQREFEHLTKHNATFRSEIVQLHEEAAETGII